MPFVQLLAKVLNHFKMYLTNSHNLNCYSFSLTKVPKLIQIDSWHIYILLRLYKSHLDTSKKILVVHCLWNPWIPVQSKGLCATDLPIEQALNSTHSCHPSTRIQQKITRIQLQENLGAVKLHLWNESTAKCVALTVKRFSFFLNWSCCGKRNGYNDNVTMNVKSSKMFIDLHHIIHQSRQCKKL